MGVAATGQTVEFGSIDMIRVEDGKVAEHWGVTDAMSLMQQVGALPEWSASAGIRGSSARRRSLSWLWPAPLPCEVSGQADAVVRIGEPRKVTVRGDDNLLEQVKTEVSGDTLEVSQDEDIDPYLGITVEIRIPRLDMAELSAAGDLTARGIRGERFRAEVSGAGSVEADGRVRSVEVVVSGAGDVRLERLVAQQAEVEVSGAGSVHVHASDSLTASVSGSATSSTRGVRRTSRRT